MALKDMFSSEPYQRFVKTLSIAALAVTLLGAVLLLSRTRGGALVFLLGLVPLIIVQALRFAERKAKNN